MTRKYRAKCHCGNIRLEFDSELAPEALSLRACGCSFCRSHGSRTTTDPKGRVRIEVSDPEALSRYSFALATAEFYICRNCGAYMGAFFDDGDKSYATLNTRYFEDAALITQAPAPTNYDGESAEARRARRRLNWTPVAH